MIVDPVTVQPGAADRRGARDHAPLPHLRPAGHQRRQAGRHPHQPRSALREAARPHGRRGDDQGEPGHRRSPGISLEEAKEILHRNRIEKLLGRRRAQPPARPDHGEGHREGGAATRTPARTTSAACASARPSAPAPTASERAERLVRAGADVLVIDTAHGHSRRVIETVRDDQGARSRRRADRRQRRHRRGRARRWSRPAPTPSRSAWARRRSAPRASSPASACRSSPPSPTRRGSAQRARHPGDRRRRHQVLRRHHQGARRRRRTR